MISPLYWAGMNDQSLLPPVLPLVPMHDYDHAAMMARGFSFTIDRDGGWHCHDPAMGAGPIRRIALARLFSGAGTGKMAGRGLSVDQSGLYRLTAPPDVYHVHVEDVPFIITDYAVRDGFIDLVTNMGETVTLSEGVTFFFRPNGPYPDVPYVVVRAGLAARLSRAVFYHLAGLADADGRVASGLAKHSLSLAGFS